MTELLFETKYVKLTGYQVFVKYCETRDWELMDQVLHDDYMCVDELAVLNKEEMRQRSIDDKKRGFELVDGKEIFDSEDALIFSHPMKGVGVHIQLVKSMMRLSMSVSRKTKKSGEK